MRFTPVVVLLLLAGTARAETPRLWHIGPNVRADLGTHPVRIGAGVQTGATDVTVVVDPMVWTDGQLDLDLLHDWHFASGWGLVTGVRWTSIGVGEGRQSQDKVVLGVGAPLAGLDGAPFRARWMFEVAAVVVKHGADLPTEWISFGDARDFVDLVNFGMSVSFEYASIF